MAEHIELSSKQIAQMRAERERKLKKAQEQEERWLNEPSIFERAIEKVKRLIAGKSAQPKAKPTQKSR